MIPRQETTTTQKWVELQTYESVDLTSPTPWPADRGSGECESPAAPYSSADEHLSVGEFLVQIGLWLMRFWSGGLCAVLEVGEEKKVQRLRKFDN
jgi:hypothetical protein